MERKTSSVVLGFKQRKVPSSLPWPAKTSAYQGAIIAIDFIETKAGRFFDDSKLRTTPVPTHVARCAYAPSVRPPSSN